MPEAEAGGKVTIEAGLRANMQVALEGLTTPSAQPEAGVPSRSKTALEVALEGAAPARPDLGRDVATTQADLDREAAAVGTSSTEEPLSDETAADQLATRDREIERLERALEDEQEARKQEAAARKQAEKENRRLSKTVEKQRQQIADLEGRVAEQDGVIQGLRADLDKVNNETVPRLEAEIARLGALVAQLERQVTAPAAPPPPPPLAAPPPPGAEPGPALVPPPTVAPKAGSGGGSPTHPEPVPASGDGTAEPLAGGPPAAAEPPRRPAQRRRPATPEPVVTEPTPELSTLEQIRTFLRDNGDNPKADPVALAAASLRLVQEVGRIRAAAREEDEPSDRTLIEQAVNTGRGFRRRGTSVRRLLNGYVVARLDEVGRRSTYGDYSRAIFAGEQLLPITAPENTIYATIASLESQMRESALAGQPLDNQRLTPEDFRLIRGVGNNLRQETRDLGTDKLVRLRGLVTLERSLAGGELPTEPSARLDEEQIRAKREALWGPEKPKGRLRRKLEEREARQRQRQTEAEVRLFQQLPRRYQETKNWDFRQRQEFGHDLDEWEHDYRAHRYGLSANRIAALILYNRIDPGRLPEDYRRGLEQTGWELGQLRNFWRRRH